MNKASLVAPVLLVATSVAGTPGVSPPPPVSPGSPERVERIADDCPTFSWAQLPGVASVRLVVYGVSAGPDGSPRILLDRQLPATATTWTPSLAECLQPGGRYAWSVGYVSDQSDVEWSEAAWFEVLTSRDRPGPEETSNGDPLGEEAAAPARASQMGQGQGSGHTHDHGELTGLGEDDHTQYFHLFQNELVRGRPRFANAMRPFDVTSAALVANLNADLLDGEHADAFAETHHGHTLAEVGGLSPGGITFGGASGALSQDAVALFWDAGTHRLGLGTPTPGYQLEITGNVGLPETTAPGGSPTAGMVFLNGNYFMHAYHPSSDDHNTFIGRNAGNLTLGGVEDEGNWNTGLGNNALNSLSTGKGNTAAGAQALQANSLGGWNAAFGAGAMENNASGDFNTAVGSHALLQALTAGHNTALGHRSLQSTTTGGGNTAAGVLSMSSTLTGEGNVAIGHSALFSATAANNNVAVGVQAGFNAIGGSNVLIGPYAGPASLDGSSGRLYIANQPGTPLIFGEFDLHRLAIHATDPSATLDVNGTLRVRDWSGTGSSSVCRDTSGVLVTCDGGAGLPPGTTGQTLRHDGASWVANDFLYNDGSHIGIGTTAPSEQLELTGSINVPDTAASGGVPSAGVLLVGGQRFLHNYATPGSWSANTFVGTNAGNFTMGGPEPQDGSNNLGAGAASLGANTTGHHNTAVGGSSLASNTTGYVNTAVGHGSLSSNTGGSFNVAVGNGALAANTTAAGNTALGYAALNANLGGGNTAAGFAALGTNTTGGENDAFGSEALRDNVSGNSNVALGYQTLQTNTTGSLNVAVGNRAGNRARGNSNVFLGSSAGPSSPDTTDNRLYIANAAGTPLVYGEFDNVRVGLNATDPAATLDVNGDLRVRDWNSGGAEIVCRNSDGLLGPCNSSAVFSLGGLPFLHNYIRPGSWSTNTFLGQNAGNFSMGGEIPSQGAHNTGIGFASLNANTTGERNTAVGTSSLSLNTSGADNTAIGTFSLGSNTTGAANVAIGNSSLGANTAGENNVAVGNRALATNTTGGQNTALGAQSLAQNTEGVDNVAVGFAAMQGNTVGNNNIAVGRHSLTGNTSGNDNVAIGHTAMSQNAEGSNNIGIGRLTLTANTSGFGNTAVGGYSMGQNTTGYENTAVGAGAMESNTTGRHNTAAGLAALEASSTGNGNAAFGMAALQLNTGDTNTAIGAGAGAYSVSTSSGVFLGYSAGFDEADSERLHIANRADRTLVFGEFDNDRVLVNRHPGESPTNTLDVNGTLRVRDWSGTGSESVCRDGNGTLVACGGSVSSSNGGLSVGAYARNAPPVVPPADGLIVSGSVGIGTSNPGTNALDVNGKARVTTLDATSEYLANGTPGMSTVVTVGDGAGGTCTMTFTQGLLTGTTCPHS